MSLYTHEWTPQQNGWNSVNGAADFEGHFDLSQTPEVPPEATVALDAMETILAWPRSDIAGPELIG